MSVLMAEPTEDASTASASAEAFFGLPAAHFWTLDDLARLPDDGRRYEIVDGSLHVAPAPAIPHQRLCAWLSRALTAGMPDDHDVLPGANVVLPAERTRLLVPDVLVVRLADLDLRRPLAAPASAVPLAVEVVSPSSTTHDRFTKPALYAEAGVAHYWRVECGVPGHSRSDGLGAGRDGPTVHVYALADGGAAYTRTHVVRPGETVALDAPWPVILTRPRTADSGGGAAQAPSRTADAS
jgi:Uma2 family endonuclease